MGNHSESPLARKIRLLMAKANDKSVTEAEAAAYAAKVQELLVNNGLSMSDIKEPDVERGEVGRSEHDEKKQRWSSPSRKALLRTVCLFYMCEAIGPAKGRTDWTIIGRPHNVEVAVSMTNYLIRTVIRLSNEWGKQNLGANVIDFRKGCMSRLTERLHTMRQAQKEAKQKWNGTNPGNLPALFASESQLVTDWKRANMRTVNAKVRPIKAGAAGYMAGQAAGDKISLQQQVGSGGGRLAIGRR